LKIENKLLSSRQHVDQVINKFHKINQNKKKKLLLYSVIFTKNDAFKIQNGSTKWQRNELSFFALIEVHYNFKKKLLIENKSGKIKTADFLEYFTEF
jgi:hypothetical protein